MNVYDRFSRVYDLFALSRLGQYKRVRKEFFGFCGIREGDRVLDIACASGGGLDPLVEAVGDKGEVVGLDILPSMIKLAKDKVEKNGWNNVRLVCASATDLPFDDREFDVVVAQNALRVIPDCNAAFDEMIRTSRNRVGILEADCPQSVPMQLFYKGIYQPIDQMMFRKNAYKDMNGIIRGRLNNLRHRTALGGLMHMWAGERKTSK
jgi:ubiquinone/menaquinone biosynthesis C-methylase UbiE